MRTLIIGDIHGCFFELQALLDKAGLSTGDQLWAVGDILDRGPETPDVLAFFEQHSWAHSIQGNHERKHIRASRGELKLALSQKISKAQFTEVEQPYPEVINTISTFPLFIELPEIIIVHGYFEPNIPLAQQKETVIAGTMSGSQHMEKNYAAPWYSYYNLDKPIAVGHRNYLGTEQPFVYKERVYGLDTSVYMGKALTGLLLPEFRLISVPAQENHWRAVRRQYNHLRPAPIPPEKRNWHGVAKWVAWAETISDPTPELVTQKRAIKELQETARAILPKLHQWIATTHQEIIQKISIQSPEYLETPTRQQGKLYHPQLTPYPIPLHRFLHLYRQEKLSLAEMELETHTPAHALHLWELTQS